MITANKAVKLTAIPSLVFGGGRYAATKNNQLHIAAIYCGVIRNQP